MMNFPHSSLPKLSPIFLERIPLKSLASSAIKAGRITQDRAVIYIIYTCLLSGITLFIKNVGKEAIFTPQQVTGEAND